jgi:hypothetical protein
MENRFLSPTLLWPHRTRRDLPYTLRGAGNALPGIATDAAGDSRQAWPPIPCPLQIILLTFSLSERTLSLEPVARVFAGSLENGVEF